MQEYLTLNKIDDCQFVKQLVEFVVFAHFWRLYPSSVVSVIVRKYAMDILW